MSLVRAIGIMLILVLCLSVLGTITSSPTATPMQTKLAVASLPAATMPANATTVVATIVAPAKLAPIAVTAALPANSTATTARVTVGSPSPAGTAAPSTTASPRSPAVRPSNARTDHATLTPHQSAAPPRTAARTQPRPVQAPPWQAFPSAPQPQQRAAIVDDPRPPKVSVNTHSHWQIPPSQSRNTSRTASRDVQKDTRTSSAQRGRAAPPPQNRTASRYDDSRRDRNSYSSTTLPNTAAHTGYRQSQDRKAQDRDRSDTQARVSDNKRKVLLREYEENARRQAEIKRKLGGNLASQPASRRDRYSDASSGRR